MSSRKVQMTKPDAARIQSAQQNAGKDMSSDGFAARAQAAADRLANATSGGGGGQNPGSSNKNSGGGSGGAGQGASSGGKN